MEVCELSSKQVINYLCSSHIGQGAYGIVIPYSNDTLLKLYYSEFQDTIENPCVRQLDKNIEHNRLWFGTRDYQELKKKCERLELCKKGTYIKGIATYKDYPLGVYMKWYKSYQVLESMLFELSNEQKKFILSQVKQQVAELMDLGIFATDIKDDNILVDPNTLDTVLIDLDDDMTICRDKDFKTYQAYVVEAYRRMEKSLHYFYKK